MPCRSAVFICDKPGSIAASIAHTKSGSDIKDMLLKKLSSGGSVGSRDEGENKTCPVGEKAEKKKAVNDKVSSRRRCSSAVSVRKNSPHTHRMLAPSKSASSTLTVKKCGTHFTSKLIISNCSTKEKVHKQNFIDYWYYSVYWEERSECVLTGLAR